VSPGGVPQVGLALFFLLSRGDLGRSFNELLVTARFFPEFFLLLGQFAPSGLEQRFGSVFAPLRFVTRFFGTEKHGG
jgi:hypothetical protein